MEERVATRDAESCGYGGTCHELKRVQTEVEECRRDISKLYTAEAQLKTRLNSIEALIERMDAKLDRILNRPGSRWETLVGALIGAACAYFFQGLLS